MLNRAKLALEFERHAGSLFIDYSDDLYRALELWEHLKIKNDFFIKQIKEQSPQNVPEWNGHLEHCIKVNELPYYAVLSVDGSQIYPDRHQGCECYLINIGSVYFSYSKMGASITRDAVPSVFVSGFQNYEASIDHVNCKRTEYEFFESLRQSKRNNNTKLPYLCLIDGSLIFWHLESKPAEIRTRYFVSYIALLQQFYELKIPIVGYISLPKSKEVINLIRFINKYENLESKISDRFEHLFDADLMAAVLPPQTRSVIFDHRSAIVESYPRMLKPSFFYINSGFEIARVEMPYWLAREEEAVQILSSIIMDQIKKGRGYPVVLAEAHETAVVKGADRDFFYRLLQRFTVARNKHYNVSQKSLKKRTMYV